MKLFLRERLMLLDIIPREGDVTTIKIVRKLREALSPTEQEHADLNVKIEDAGSGTMSIWWDEIKEQELGPADLTFTMKETEIIKSSFRKLSENKKFTESHIELYDKFEALE